MPFEKGHKLSPGGGHKPFHAALKRAIAQDNGQRVRDCAEKLLDLAAAGEPWAVKELIDRLDGKAPQAIEVTTPRDVTEWTLEQLTASLATAAGAASGGAAAPSGAGQSGPVH